MWIKVFILVHNSNTNSYIMHKISYEGVRMFKNWTQDNRPRSLPMILVSVKLLLFFIITLKYLVQERPLPLLSTAQIQFESKWMKILINCVLFCWFSVFPVKKGPLGIDVYCTKMYTCILYSIYWVNPLVPDRTLKSFLFCFDFAALQHC